MKGALHQAKMQSQEATSLEVGGGGEDPFVIYGPLRQSIRNRAVSARPQLIED